MIKKIKDYFKELFLSKEKILQYKRCKPWFDVKGDETLRLNYPLNKESIVFDLGGYKGEFASSIYNLYKSHIYIFEPVPSFFQIINNTFINNDKVFTYNYGLSAKDCTVEISSTDDGSSVYINSSNSQKIKLKSIVGFIKKNKIKKIDLIKINIEGGEYEVLEALLENNMISIFKNIQVQFHDFIIQNAEERMINIQRKLELTHELTYQYVFVWENWKLK
tara:strand:- start:221 stop:880 length:660 start_codon:yes stop_codon:yes gene_type:complete